MSDDTETSPGGVRGEVRRGGSARAALWRRSGVWRAADQEIARILQEARFVIRTTNPTWAWMKAQRMTNPA